MLLRRIALIVILAAICAPAMADGMMFPVERPHSTIVVPDKLFTVKYHHVNVTISDQLAVTKVDQIFHNDTGVEREGMYVFPMPEGSAITKFSMFAGEQEIRGAIMDKAEARRIYESIVRQRKDPAILEYIDRNTFRASVYPIPANGDKRIRLDYSEVVERTGSTCRYIYPLSTERFSARPLEDCKVKIKIFSKKPITNVYSPTHKIDVDHTTANEVRVTWETKNTKPDTDLILYYTVSNDDIGVDLIAHRERGEKGFYMLLASPRVDIDKSKVQSKNVVFVLDRTGSMAGEKIDQAKDALKFCVNSLRAEDRFNVITFNESPDPLFHGLKGASAAAVKTALGKIEDIEASGGTNIHDAIKRALAQFVGMGKSRNYIVFLTDGLPTVGVTNPETILTHAKGANDNAVKVFAFGVGYDVNTHLLDRLTTQARGDADYVRPRENIETKVSEFFAKVSDPILADVKLAISGVSVSDAFPSGDLPDIFKGSQLIVFGRYSGSGNVTVELSGTVNDSGKTFKIEADLPDVENENEFIPQLWAARKIGYLLDEIRLHSNQELIDEVVRLSKEYGIPTEFTSFLADDRKMATDMVAATSGALHRATRANKSDSGTYGVAQSSNSRDLRNQSQVLAASAPAAEAAPGARVIGARGANQRAGAVYKDENDNFVVVANVQNIARRTFYQRGNFWEDAGVAEKQQFTQVRQFSDAHFALLKRYPKLSQYSQLGNVRVILENNNGLEIGPEGKDQLTDKEIDSLLRNLPAKSGSSLAPTSGWAKALVILAVLGMSLPATRRLRRLS